MSYLNSERDIIGSILSEPEMSLFECHKVGLTVHNFEDASMATIYGCILDLESKSKPIDFASVSAHITDMKCGTAHIMQAMEDSITRLITTANVEYNCSKLIEVSRRKDAVALLRKGIESIENDKTVPLNEHKERIFNKLITIDDFASVKITKLKDHKDDKIKQWDDAKGRGFIGVPSSLPSLNSYLGGYRKSLAIVGGYRGTGKSSFLRQEVLSQAKKGYVVALFTLEDPSDIASASIVGNEADVNTYPLDVGLGTQSSVDKMAETWDKIGDLPVYIINNAYSIDSIIATAKLIKKTNGLDIIYIDHIQYISPIQLPNMNRVTTMSVYSHQLAMLAKNLSVAVVCASQLNRSCETEDRDARLSDLRDSGSLEQDARQVCLIGRGEQGDEFILHVAKNNYGPAGQKIKMVRLDAVRRFEERDEQFSKR